MRANVLLIGALLLGTSVSAQDLDNCAKADVILSTVVANLADCGQTFIASVSATELQPFCSLLFDGLKCAAGKLAPEKEDECFDRMIQLVENDPSAVFDRIKPLLAAMGENIELRFVNQVGECSIYKTLGNCVNIGVIVQTVVANVADCGQKFIASVSATEFQPFCSLL
ncbi:uncharacterized protein LOC132729731, partial [Ruditapes philippinarum]|uniref:uncharacterized protein LOC132729731 n=1 Tax=Ruditapes philippinarum TaxID=129788 RepID=UPI00295AD378